ncbi:zeta toxin family protein [Mannheimia pernigra]|uniref:zeta toxin family protein n=1 Tax=Mannheimia pernigra TaxID=111844 RepID=UPI00159F421A|nr:zeta toxin family protein [Mannheimia pernigra]QLB44551.1 zeta toxin family protein [Mannheimia pernigra]
MFDYDVEADLERKIPYVWANLLAENNLVPEQNPIAILLGGQPGAGKSFGSLEMSKRLNFNLLVINGDEFRPYHQYYHEIYQRYGKDASKYTGEFTGKMVQRVRNEAIKHRFNILIEGTLRTVDIPLNELENFRTAGYQTAVLICTCPKEISWKSTLKRAEEQAKNGIQPRYVPREHFDLVIHSLAENALKVLMQGKPESFEVYSRTQKLFDSKIDPEERLVAIIEHELHRTEDETE